jgi:hypothetical protein
MKVDADFTPRASRLIYRELPDPLTSADLKRFFRRQLCAYKARPFGLEELTAQRRPSKGLSLPKNAKKRSLSSPAHARSALQDPQTKAWSTDKKTLDLGKLI